MTEKPDEWPHVERRRDHALREDVEHLLRQVRETHGRMKAMGDSDTERVQSRFLWQVHVIWDRLLEEMKQTKRAEHE